MAQLVVTVDAVGVRCTDTRVGLDDDGITDLREELLGSGKRCDLREARGRDARLLVKGLHCGLVLDMIHITALPARANVEVRAQTCIALEPVLVVRLDPVDAAIFECKECNSAQHLIVVGERGNEVILCQRLAYLMLELVVWCVADAEDVDTLLFQTVAEVPVDARELRGNKDKVHVLTSFHACSRRTKGRK